MRSNEQLADIMTKLLSSKVFNESIDKLKMKYIYMHQLEGGVWKSKLIQV
jgi:hypothetical protein